MANLVDVLQEKNKNNYTLSLGAKEPVRYNNPIARLSVGAIPLRDPNYAVNTNAISKAKPAILPKAQ
jgi:hypothetical protein